MRFSEDIRLKHGLRFGISALQEFDRRVKQLFPGTVRLTIDARFGRAVCKYDDVAKFMGERNLPEMIYDVSFTWYGEEREYSADAPMLFLRRLDAVVAHFEALEETWVIGAITKFLEIAKEYAYYEALETLEDAPLSIVVYPHGLPGKAEVFVASIRPEREAPITSSASVASDDYTYDFALSYASSESQFVEEVARCLNGRQIRVFFDKFEIAELAGANLQRTLTEIYLKKSRFAVAFVSREYCNRKWPGLESEAILARTMENRGAIYLIPIRIDDSELSGLLPTIGYIDARVHNATTICALLSKKLGVSPAKDNILQPPRSLGPSGLVQFDYSSHDGKFEIGMGHAVFETQWSKASDAAIHCYNDPASILGLALAPEGVGMEDITNAAALDYTSRVRTPEIGQIVILKNIAGFFAGLHIVAISDRNRGADRDELTFDYRILVDGSADFSKRTDCNA